MKDGDITDDVKSKLLNLGLTEEEISIISLEGNRFNKRPSGNTNYPLGNDTEVVTGRVNLSGSQVVGEVLNRKNLFTYIGSLTLVLVLTFFIGMKKRNY